MYCLSRHWHPIYSGRQSAFGGICEPHQPGSHREVSTGVFSYVCFISSLLYLPCVVDEGKNAAIIGRPGFLSTVGPSRVFRGRGEKEIHSWMKKPVRHGEGARTCVKFAIHVTVKVYGHQSIT